MFLGSFKMELPEFDHLLPEIAMLGHSNTGKVTFLYYRLVFFVSNSFDFSLH